MKRLYLPILILLTGMSPVAAQSVDGDRPIVAVLGRGEAERTPDAFFIGGSIRAEGATQIDALQTLATRQNEILASLADMDGLTASKYQTRSISAEPVYAADCPEGAREQGSCPATAYSVSVGFQFKGSPASEAGNALSLAAELGATSVGFSTTEVDDMASLRAEANRLAFADARRQAEIVATASGGRLGRVLRIQDANARWPGSDSGQVEDIVVTGSRIRPSVALPVQTPPVTVHAELTVIFELD